jgi:hypothetical protein
MPAAGATRGDDDFLDADIGRVFRLELDPVAVHLGVVGEVRGDESRRREIRRQGCDSDSRERSDHDNAGGAATHLFLERNARISPLPLDMHMDLPGLFDHPTFVAFVAIEERAEEGSESSQ